MFSFGNWILLLLPLCVTGLWLFLWRRKIDRRNERKPVTLTLLRPPGESLRLKIQELDEKLSEHLFLVVSCPIALVIVHATKPVGDLALGILVGVTLIPTIYFTRKAIKTAEVLRNYRLGFHGERACGEQLNQLMLHGCRVFHDVPMAPYGNIDHVIVAPTGIYAVETKTRRIRKMSDRREDHVVLYDGKILRFPFGTSERPLAQARQQANRLQSFLSSAVGESITISPILAIPGWYVRRTCKGGIPALNPKVVRREVLNLKKPRLSPQLLKRVAHQLEQRCRDVTA